MAKTKGLSLDEIIPATSTQKARDSISSVDPLDNIGANYKSGKLNPALVAVQSAGKAAGDVLNLSPLGWVNKGIGALGGAIGGGVDWAARKIFPAAGSALRNVIGAPNVDAMAKNVDVNIGAALSTPLGKATVGAVKQMSNDPAVTGSVESIMNLLNLGGTAALFKGGMEALPKVGSTISKSAPIVAAKDSLKAKYIKQSSDAWYQAAEGKVKPTKILNKSQGMGKDPVGTLSARGIHPRDHVSSETKKLDTSAISSNMRNESVQKGENVLDRSLQKLDYQKKPTPLTTIRDKALANVDSSNLTSGNKLALKAKINSEFEAIANEKKSSDINLFDSNAEKRKYWRDTFGDRVEVKNVQSSASYQIGRAFKESIETGAGGDVNVTELSGHLGELYDTANFLDSMNGKRLPITLGQKVVGYGMKLAGTAVGEYIGGTAGGVAGYYGGRAISDLLQTASNPLRTMIIKDLQANDPQALQDAIAWVKQQNVNESTQLRLPPATGQSPIPMPEYKGGESKLFPSNKVNPPLLKQGASQAEIDAYMKAQKAEAEAARQASLKTNPSLNLKKTPNQINLVPKQTGTKVKDLIPPKKSRRYK